MAIATKGSVAPLTPVAVHGSRFPLPGEWALISTGKRCREARCGHLLMLHDADVGGGYGVCHLDDCTCVHGRG